MNIYPSVLETSSETFKKRLTDYGNIFPHLQIDVADGIYVDNTTISLGELLKIFGSRTSFAEDHTIELHLMVQDPQQYIQTIKEINSSIPVTRLLLHIDQVQIIDFQNYEFQVGLVLNPEHSVDTYWDMLSQVQTIQIMTISPGKQGQPFLPETIGKISQLREKGFTGEIILDGGMNEKNLDYIIKNSRDLPDTICPGSYFHADAEKKLARLNRLLP